MLAVCAECDLSVSWGVFGLCYLRSIYFFPLFSRSLSFLFLDDDLILDGNSQRAIKSKTANLAAIQRN